MPDGTDLRILIVLTSHDRLGGQTGSKTGVWLESFVSPYFIFRDAGADVTLASPTGGKPPIDPASHAVDFPAAIRFAEDECCRAALADTLSLEEIYASDFDAAFYPGGFGAYWDLATDNASAGLIASLHAAGKPVALVGQAVAALCSVLAPTGRPLVDGRQLCGFSDRDAAASGLAGILPFSLETRLRMLGATFRHDTGTVASSFIQDGLLITGATVATSDAVARTLMQTMPSPKTDI